MLAVVFALALIGQDLPDEAATPLRPADDDWVFRASLNLWPSAQICPADSPARGRARRDVLVVQFHSNAAASLTETQCGRQLTHVDLTPREAGLLLGLFKPENYEIEPADHACANPADNLYEMIAQGHASRVAFRCAGPQTLTALVGDLRKMMVAQYAN